MKSRWLTLLLLLFLVPPAYLVWQAVVLVTTVAAQGTTGGTGSVGTPAGFVWTYFGPTYGAGWAAPATGGITPITLFGATCNGIADDTTAMKAAAAASGIGSVGAITLLAGQKCNFSEQIQFANTNSPGFVCTTPGYCAINWTGAADANPILFASRDPPFGASEIIEFRGGTGYASGDTVTLNDGCATHGVLTIGQATGGVPNNARITTMGSCATMPAKTLNQLSTSGSGSGMVIDMAYGSLNTRINYPILKGVVLTSSTKLTTDVYVREIFVYQAVISETRMFGADNIWQGFSFQRAQYTEISDLRIDQLQEQSIRIGGTDQGGNANIGTHLRNVIFAGCNSSITTKVVAHFKGCLRIEDNVGGLFLSDRIEAYSHKGYAVYFGATLGHEAGNNLSALAYIDGLNVEATGPFSGSIGGGNWTTLDIGGPACWLTGSNLDVIDFYTTALHDVRIICQIHPSQNDGSVPFGINFKGRGLTVTGSMISGYTGGTGGINLAPTVEDFSVTGTTIANLATGIQGSTNTGGIKTLSNVNFRYVGTDLVGLNCGDFQVSWAAGVGTLGKPLCPGNITGVVGATRDLSAPSGTQVVTGLTAPSGFSFIPSTCSFMGSNSVGGPNYIALNGWSDNAGRQTALYQNVNGVNLAPVNTAVMVAGDGAGNYQQASVTGYDMGNVTLTWTKAGSPTGTFYFSVTCSQ